MSDTSYISDAAARKSALVPDTDDAEVWELLIEGVSRLFDREAGVSDGFFLPAAAEASERTVRANGTRYVKLPPYIGESIVSIVDPDSVEYWEAVAEDRSYYEKDGYLIFNRAIADGVVFTISARFGFPAVPSDIQVACIEQALFQWRRKDLAFADLSGVSSAAITAEFSPTFIAATRHYREIYSDNNFFV